MTTALIVGHPDLAASRLSASLVDTATRLPGVDLRILKDLGPAAVFDVAREQDALAAADRIVLLYPTYWYSTPGILKAWMDQVFTRGWAYGTGGSGALAGKTLTVVTSTGGAETAYHPGALHSFEYDAILAPLKATAHRLGMVWGEPIVVHGVRDVDVVALDEIAGRFREVLAPIALSDSSAEWADRLTADRAPARVELTPAA